MRTLNRHNQTGTDLRSIELTLESIINDELDSTEVTDRKLMIDTQTEPINEGTGTNGMVGRQTGRIGGQLKVPWGHQSTSEMCTITRQVQTDTDPNKWEKLVALNRMEQTERDWNECNWNGY